MKLSIPCKLRLDMQQSEDDFEVMTVVAVLFHSLRGGFELQETGINYQALLLFNLSCSSLFCVRLCFDSHSPIMPWNPH